MKPGKNYKLANDIVLSGPVPVNSPFNLIFDGNGHRISHLRNQYPAAIGFNGLFSQVVCSVVKDLYVEDIALDQTWINSYTGGLAGVISISLISNVHLSRGSVRSAGTVGGLVGVVGGGIIEKSSVDLIVGKSAIFGAQSTNYAGGLTALLMEKSKIVSSHSHGEIDGANYIGGLVGHSRGAIYNSYSTTNVTRGDFGGGLAGDSTGEIVNSYATGNITQVVIAGGLVGSLILTPFSGLVTKVVNSFAQGDVTANSAGGLIGEVWLGDGSVRGAEVANSYATGKLNGSYNGGLVASMNMSPPSVIRDSYWDMESTGHSTSKGNAIGKTTAQMKIQTTYAGWDFANIWALANGGYPTLR